MKANNIRNSTEGKGIVDHINIMSNNKKNENSKAEKYRVVGSPPSKCIINKSEFLE